jgi:hypothetical protein
MGSTSMGFGAANREFQSPACMGWEGELSSREGS